MSEVKGKGNKGSPFKNVTKKMSDRHLSPERPEKNLNDMNFSVSSYLSRIAKAMDQEKERSHSAMDGLEDIPSDSAEHLRS